MADTLSNDGLPQERRVKKASERLRLITPSSPRHLKEFLKAIFSAELFTKIKQLKVLFYSHDISITLSDEGSHHLLQEPETTQQDNDGQPYLYIGAQGNWGLDGDTAIKVFEPNKGCREQVRAEIFELISKNQPEELISAQVEGKRLNGISAQITGALDDLQLSHIEYEDLVHVPAPVKTRAEVEAEILSAFNEVTPLSSAVQDNVNTGKQGQFAWSMMGIALYCTGYSLNGTSEQHKLGLLYRDEEGNMFGLGYFKKQQSTSPNARSYLHIVAPNGPSIVQAVTKFIKKYKKELLISDDLIYIRHLPRALAQSFLQFSATYSVVTPTSYPWHPQASQEDETYSHGTVTLDEIIVLPGETFNKLDRRRQLTTAVAQEITIKTLRSDLFSDSDGNDDEKASNNLRTRSRRDWKRCKEWLKQNSLRVNLSPANHYDSAQDQSVLNLLQEHFESLRLRNIDIGSDVQDYLGFLELQKRPEIDQSQFKSFIISLVDNDGKTVPVAYFAGEYISQDKQYFALYSSVTSRREELYSQYKNPSRGLSTMSRYVTLRVLAELKKAGVKVVKLGGSETQALDIAKMYLGAIKEKTQWLVV